MSFLKIKPTEIELKKLKSKRDFYRKGKNLLEIKREQLFNLLQDLSEKFFEKKRSIRKRMLEEFEVLQDVYRSVGKFRLKSIAALQENLLDVSISLSYIKEMGLAVPDIKLDPQKKKLPSYSLRETSIHLDKIIKDMRNIMKDLTELATIDHKLYRVSQEHLKIRRRINALEDNIMPKLEHNIKKIEEILEDNEREEFIRMKKIKEQFESEKENSEQNV